MFLAFLGVSKFAFISNSPFQVKFPAKLLSILLKDFNNLPNYVSVYLSKLQMTNPVCCINNVVRLYFLSELVG